MPEWPDLHVVRGRLEKALVAREIVLVRVGDPLVLRATHPVETALAHRRFTGVRHRGKFLIFDLDKGAIVVNPMLAGVFELDDAEAKLTRTTALSLVLDNGKDLRYRDDKRMGKVHVLDAGVGTSSVHGFDDSGRRPASFHGTSASLPSARVRPGVRYATFSRTRRSSRVSATRTPTRFSGRRGCTPNVASRPSPRTRCPASTVR